jgi:hypothetical protein
MVEIVKSETSPVIAKRNQDARVNIALNTNKVIKHNEDVRITRFTFNPSVVSTRLLSGTGTEESGVATANFMYDQTPNETPNGVLQVFSLPNSDAYVSGKIEVFLDGLLQLKPDDYSETAPTLITFVTAPRADESVRFNYIKA